jgi:hypothetical protein
MTDTERPSPPPLQMASPDCSICGHETNPVDNEFVCDNCNCSWPVDDIGGIGTWDDDQVGQCTATVKPRINNDYFADDDPKKHEEFRCVLDADHPSVDEAGLAGRHGNPAMDHWVKGWI